MKIKDKRQKLEGDILLAKKIKSENQIKVISKKMIYLTIFFKL